MKVYYVFVGLIFIEKCAIYIFIGYAFVYIRNLCCNYF